METRNLAVIGLGYVGLPLAYAAWATNQYHVTGYDINRPKVADLRTGHSPIEDVTDLDVREMISSGSFDPTSDRAALRGADVYVVTVPTPLYDGQPDLTAVTAAGIIIGETLDALAPGREVLVVLESTVAPGTTTGPFLDAINTDRGPRDQLVPGRDGFHLAYSPERIDPGNRTYNFGNTPKLVAGVTEACHTRAMRFYRDITEEVRPVTSPEVAEAAKLLENSYRHVNIALVNEFARHMHALHIDVWDVIDAAATKPYGFQPFYPGPGVGGHCLPVDPVYLSEQVRSRTGHPFDFINLAVEVNNGQPDYVVSRAAALLNESSRAVRGSRILVLGYAYKADTADARETPVAGVVAGLLKLGGIVTVVDPHTGNPGLPDGVTFIGGEWDGEAQPDLVIVATDHSAFADAGIYKQLAALGVPILDTRNAVPRDPWNVHRL